MSERMAHLLPACLALLIGLIPAASAQLSCPIEWPLGYYGQTQGRTWQRIPILAAGSGCGDGSAYAMFFARGPDQIAGQPNNRTVIWLPGGGSTMMRRDGTLESPISSLAVPEAAPWWRGPVIYQIYPRSFLGTDGNGVGDLPGIASLGVDGIWITLVPEMDSPMPRD